MLWRCSHDEADAGDLEGTLKTLRREPHRAEEKGIVNPVEKYVSSGSLHNQK